MAYMPSEMSVVWRVRIILTACGIKDVVVSAAAALPIQSTAIILMVLGRCTNIHMDWCNSGSQQLRYAIQTRVCHCAEIRWLELPELQDKV